MYFDRGLLFKILNYVVIVFGAITVLLAIIEFGAVAFFVPSGDDIVYGGVTLLMFLVLLPSLAVGILSFVAGRAGLTGNVYTCRKCARLLAIFAAWGLVGALKQHSVSFISVLTTLVDCVYCYLAYTENY
ncbi:MAG: hypothetical protein MJ071_04940 [Oscillospiraceae bacterium]|nr:hypothetical protein [Oscillospiraceae bacterium]